LITKLITVDPNGALLHSGGRSCWEGGTCYTDLTTYGQAAAIPLPMLCYPLWMPRFAGGP